MEDCCHEEASDFLATMNNTQPQKKLIVHADDFGLCSAVNRATVKLLREKKVTSVSIMPPCPGFDEAAASIRENEEWDVGVHLTLTSEWPNYKCGPVASRDKVASLVDGEGHLFATVEELLDHACVEDIAFELRAQVEKVLTRGISPTHLDCHMFACFERPDLIEVYINVARDYGIPCLLSREYIAYRLPDLAHSRYQTDHQISPDYSFMVVPRMVEMMGGQEKCYERLLGSLREGVTILLVHPGYDNDEMRSVTGEQLDYGAQWRQQDTSFFSSERYTKLLREQNIALTTWRETQNGRVSTGYGSRR